MNWKTCTVCGGEFLVVVKGLCAGCAKWAFVPRHVDPGASGAKIEAPRQDLKMRAAGDMGDEDSGESAEIE